MNNGLVVQWFSHLKKVNDPVIASLVDLIGCPITTLPKWDSIDDAIISIIIGQMLSLKAASKIKSRLYSILISSDSILDWAINNRFTEKSIYGLSIKKIKSIAHWALSGERSNFHLKIFNNTDDVIKYFINVHGIGIWSCDMLSVFYFCFPDVLPTSDLNVKKYIRRYFSDGFPSHLNGLETIICICLWEAIDRTSLCL